MKSSTPVTKTPLGAFQLVGVNVRVSGNGAPSSGRSEARRTTTSLMGWEVSATVKLDCAPPSLVGPDTEDTVKPAVSSSVLVIATLAGMRFEYAGSVLIVAAKVML